MTDRPDVEWPESVRIDGEPGFLTAFLAVVAIAFVLLAGLFAWAMLFGSGQWHPVFGWNGDTIMLLAFLALAALIVWWLRTARFDCAWKTDPEALTSAGFLLQRRIAWSDVDHVETRWHSLFLGRRHIIRSGRKAILVPDKNPALSASVWQHLRRVGKADGLVLSPEAEALWDIAREPAPAEITWTNGDPPVLWQVVAKAAVVAAAGISLSLWFYLTHHRVLSWLVAVLALSVFAWIWSALERVTRFTLGADGFEADTLFRHIRRRWDDVRGASLMVDSIQMRYSWISTIRVPWFDWDESSQRLALAIIQRLRTTARPIHLSIPDDLLAESEDD